MLFPPLSTVFADWIEQAAHHCAASGPAETAKTKAFVATRLVAATSVLLAAPVWIAFYGAPNSTESLTFLLAQAPLVSLGALFATKNLRLAQSVSIAGWLILASGSRISAPNHPTISALFLGIAFVEAMSSFEIAKVYAVAAASLGLLALEAGLVEAGALESLRPFELATSSGDAIFVAPLFGYIAILGVGLIRIEQAKLKADGKNADELRLLKGAIGDLVIRFDHGGAASAVIGEGHRTYGLDARDLMGRGFFQRVHVADRPAFLKLISDAMVAESATTTIRLRVSSIQNEASQFVHPVFNSFEARTCDSGAGDGNERLNSVVCVLRDVTAAKRAEEYIAAARLESEMAAAGKTRFLANVSHELRTPLNAIIGFSEMLANDGLAPADPAKRREYAEIIRSSGQHLLAIVNTILDMSKIESGSMQLFPEPFSLIALVDQCCDMMQLRADQKHVALTRDYAKDLEEIVADERACKQIIINLLSNAVKFTPAFGQVKVRLYPEGNSVAIAVIDNGVGISSGDLARLGDPFFQASSSHDREYEGTGLGLSLVRGLVGLHGGSIVVESAPQRGTHVTIRLPLDCRTQQSASPSLAKIDTIVRRGPLVEGTDLTLESEVVKKIA